MDSKFSYNQEPPKIPAGLSTNRAVRKADEISEGNTSRKKFSLDGDVTSKEEEENTPSTSPFQLIGGAGKKDSSSSEEQSSHLGEGKKGSQIAEQGLKERPFELVTPLHGAMVSTAEVEQPRSTQKLALDQLMQQLVETASILKAKEQTEMVLVLRHPPLFAGATLQLTSFATARGQFNIAFSNLSPDAKRLLDLASTRDSLTEQLAAKGFTLHIFVATTEKETPLLPSSADPKKNKEDQEPEEEQKKQR